MDQRTLGDTAEPCIKAGSRHCAMPFTLLNSLEVKMVDVLAQPSSLWAHHADQLRPISGAQGADVLDKFTTH